MALVSGMRWLSKACSHDVIVVTESILKIFPHVEARNDRFRIPFRIILGHWIISLCREMVDLILQDIQVSFLARVLCRLGYGPPYIYSSAVLCFDAIFQLGIRGNGDDNYLKIQRLQCLTLACHTMLNTFRKARATPEDLQDLIHLYNLLSRSINIQVLETIIVL